MQTTSCNSALTVDKRAPVLKNEPEISSSYSSIQAVIDKPAQSPLERVLSFRYQDLKTSTRRGIDVFLFVSVLILASAAWVKPEILSLGGWGYLGAFVVNAISTATILLPAPGFAAIFAVADQYNPVLLGIATGLGGAVGSLTAYWVGSKSQRFLKGGRLHVFLSRMMERFGGVVLFLSSFIFFMPADVASIIAGTTKYPMARYFVYVTAGHVLKMVLIFWVLNRYFEYIRMMF